MHSHGCRITLQPWYDVRCLDFSRILTLALQEVFGSVTEEASVNPHVTLESALFYATLDCYLVPFVTSEWLEDALGFLDAGILDAARTLCPGEMLCDKYLWVWPNRQVSSTAGSTSTFLRPVAPSPVTTGPSLSSPASSLQPSKLSPLVLPATSRIPSSNSGVPSPASGGAFPLVPSPLTLPGPSTESAPHHGHSAARSGYHPPMGGTPTVVPSSVLVLAAPALGPSLFVAPQTSKKCPINDVKMAAYPPEKQWKSCQCCSIKKWRCTPSADAKPPLGYPCAFCKLEKVPCLLPSSALSAFSFCFPFILIDLSGSLLGQKHLTRPVQATCTQTLSKQGGSSICPVSSNIAAILSKAAEFRINIPSFPTDDAFPDDLLGVPTHGFALASVENLISWNCKLWNSWRNYASAHIAHNVLLAQVEISKQRITNNDERCRLAWAAWCYLQGCALVANPPDSLSPKRSKS